MKLGLIHESGNPLDDVEDDFGLVGIEPKVSTVEQGIDGDSNSSLYTTATLSWSNVEAEYLHVTYWMGDSYDHWKETEDLGWHVDSEKVEDMDIKKLAQLAVGMQLRLGAEDYQMCERVAMLNHNESFEFQFTPEGRKLRKLLSNTLVDAFDSILAEYEEP
jgi:hypothetical protein